MDRTANKTDLEWLVFFDTVRFVFGTEALFML